jgi:putative ABC transport system ATP-binding protein
MTENQASQIAEIPSNQGIEPVPLIRLVEVVKVYTTQSSPVRALKGIHLEVRQGEFLAITGRSGSGKTTLINLLSGLDKVTSGEIWVGHTPIHTLGEGQAAAWRGKNIGVIFQSFHLIPTLTVLQNVTLPMDFAGRETVRQRKERGMALLNQLGIEQHAHKRPAQVSGGQQQRVAIARSLANDSPVLVADEPTGSLDSKTAQSVIEIFRELADKGKTVVMVTHDLELASSANRMITLFDGEIR